MALYPTAEMTLEELEHAIAQYQPDDRHSHDPFVKVAIEESIAAFKEGNYAVGACLVRDGRVVVSGHNRVYYPYFRSDLHGEMDVMTQFEDEYRNAPNVDEYELFTSLEPCAMCTIRLITAGVGKVFYASLDEESGMMATMDRLTPVWVEMAQRQEFGMARCSPELQYWAKQSWLISAEVTQQRTIRGERGV
ncbi:MAG: nucleoside deaminase [Acidimicrobiia bacterium]|nr:nucleoside deaminase [Acidimicrobiia bacterium]